MWLELKTKAALINHLPRPLNDPRLSQVFQRIWRFATAKISSNSGFTRPSTQLISNPTLTRVNCEPHKNQFLYTQGIKLNPILIKRVKGQVMSEL